MHSYGSRQGPHSGSSHCSSGLPAPNGAQGLAEKLTDLPLFGSHHEPHDETLSSDRNGGRSSGWSELSPDTAVLVPDIGTAIRRLSDGAHPWTHLRYTVPSPSGAHGGC
jgi:hypothetical protein